MDLCKLGSKDWNNRCRKNDDESELLKIKANQANEFKKDAKELKKSDSMSTILTVTRSTTRFGLKNRSFVPQTKNS